MLLKGEKESNLISCEHIDSDNDMLCDVCSFKLPLSNYFENQVLENKNASGENIISVAGKMPKDTNLSINEIGKEEANSLTNQLTNNNVEIKSIEGAYDISLIYNEEKFQPEEYGNSVKVKLSNLDLDETKAYALLHIKDDGNYEILPVKILNNNELEFKATSFSVYILVTVGTNTVTFSGDGNYTIFDENLNEITDGMAIADGTNFTFTIVPNDGYGITGVTSLYASGDSAVTITGYVKGREGNIASVSEDLVIEITTALAPVITTQPVSVKVAQGGTATFTVAADNATTYYWEYRENRDTYWKAAGSTSATLSISGASIGYTGYEYRCLVGNDSFTLHERIPSDIVALTVCQDEIIVGETPVIMVQPTMDISKVKINSGKASYSVTAMGTNLTFTWQYRENEDDYWKDITTSSIGSAKTSTPAESTTAKPLQQSTFTTATAIYGMAGYQFRCLVGNNYYQNHDAVKSDVVKISVADDDIIEQVKYLKLDITAQPESQKVKLGDTATFTIATNGVTTYKWQYQPSGETFWLDASAIGSGYNTRTLTVDTSSVTLDENLNVSGDLVGAMFRCVVSNSSVPTYTKNSDVAVLSVAQDEYASEGIKVSPNVNNATVTVTLPDEERIYNGTAHKPVITVKDGDTLLTLGTDYTVTYGENINAGTGTITITGAGDYGGTRVVEFEIAKRAITIKAGSGTKEYDGTVLTNSKYEITAGSTLDGHSITVVTSGEQTEVGSSENTIASVKIEDANKNDVTNNYEITTEAGTLTVTEDIAKYMITEWTIPAGGATITLPVSGTGLDIYVDWGDGSEIQHVTTAFPTHTYTNTEEQKFEISIRGTCPVWGCNNAYYSLPDENGERQLLEEAEVDEYYTYRQYLTGLKQWGELNAIRYGFSYCKNLKEVLPNSTENTFNKVTTMEGMFRYCTLLRSLDLRNFDTSNVTTMYGMFSNCTNLESLDVSKFNTSNVTNMYAIFYNCNLLMELDVSNFNTENVTTMYGMFRGCSSLKSLDVSEFNTSKVTDMYDMFSNCTNLESLDVSKFNTENVTNMGGMFRGCSSLESLDVSRFNTSKVTDMYAMFSTCTNLESLDVSKFNTSNVTNMYGMFYDCSSLKELDVSNFNTENVTTMMNMFYNCNKLKELNVKGFNTSNVTDMYGMFLLCSSLESLDVSGFDTKNVTTMMNMFYKCSSLEKLNVNNFDTTNVKLMRNMFYGCTSLKSLDVSNFDTKNVTDMYCMFSNCSSLESLDISNFDTSKVTDMISMFNTTTNLKSILVSNKFVTPTTSGDRMFSNTANLEAIIITSETPNGDQFASVKSQLAGKIIYVPNDSEVAYEQAFENSFTADVIHPILELIGDESVSILLNEDYTEQGYTVAGFTQAELTELGSGDENLFGYNVSTSGDVDTSVAGKYLVEYILTRTYDIGDTTDIVAIGTRNVEVVDKNKYMITEWTIPAGGATITLPVSGTGLDIYVDWGDESEIQHVTTALPTHTYTNTEEKKYDISIKGTCPVWGCNNAYYSLPDENGNSSTLEEAEIDEFYTYRQYLTGLKQWGELNATTYGFSYCKNLKEVSPNPTEKTFDNVTSMVRMFMYCTSLTNLDLSNFDTTNVTTMHSMFFGCSSLESLNVSNFDTTNVTDMRWMFFKCSSLESLDVSNFDTSNVTNMNWMFYNCSSLKELDVSNFNTQNVTTLQGMFNNCSSLKEADVSNFNTQNVTNMSLMFNNCSSLKELDVSNFNTSNVENMRSMFCGCSSVKSLDVSNFDTKNVTGMYYMFSNCSSLESLNVSNFDTTKVTDMYAMFSKCTSLKELNVSNFDTSNVETMRSMFNGCSSLKELDLSNFDTKNVTTMRWMIASCNSLKSIDVSNFDTKNVTDMYCMFYNCSSLESIDVSNFDTTNVENMNGMFSGCSSLESLDLSNFDTSKVTDMAYMFITSTNLKSILVSNKFVTPTTSGDRMFSNTANLEAIIITSDTPSVDQFASVKSQLAGKIIYVPNDSEVAYEQAFENSFTADVIHPILELIGDERVSILLNEDYTDKGYTVAGFTQTELTELGSGDENLFGYTVSTSGDVDTSVAGKYLVEYTLTRENSEGVVLGEESKVIRTVIIVGSADVTLYENDEIYDGEWTNQDVMVVVTLIDGSGWINVKLGNGEWTEEPTFTEIVPSGDKLIMLFQETINDTLYVKEVDAAGNDMTDATSGDTIKIDKEKPVVISFEFEETKLKAVVTDSASGITHYAITETAVRPLVWLEYTGTIEQDVIESGAYYLWVRDAAGNEVSGYRKSIASFEDILPPYGGIAIIDALDVNANNYLDRTTAKVEIYAKDDKCADEEIKYYISTSPITNTERISEWKDYEPGKVEEIALPNVSGTNVIYAVFKDKTGNTSRIYVGGEAKYKVTYDANGGEDAPASQDAYYGMPLRLSNERPEKEGQYFLGWSTTKADTVDDLVNTEIYEQGEILLANTFTMEETEITLYAVWADNISDLPLLSGRIEVGDYVNYPVFYNNANGVGANLNGWRVLSIEPDGTINLVSAGVPLTYYYYGDVDTAINNLNNNFTDTAINSSANNSFRKTGFTAYEDLEKAFSNVYTVESGVRAMSKEDLDIVYDNTELTIATYSTNVKDAKYENLLAVPTEDGSYAAYWLISDNNDETIWYMTTSGTLSESSNAELGIRPVVSLKPDVKTTGMDSKGAWDIEVELEICTVTFDANGGLIKDTSSVAVTKNLAEGTVYGVLPEAVREGYTFAGWFNSDDEEITSESYVHTTGTQIITAKWFGNKYIVTLNNEGGTLESKEVTFGEIYGDLPILEKDDYNFLGWFTEDGIQVYSDTLVEIVGNHTLNAQWENKYNSIANTPVLATGMNAVYWTNDAGAGETYADSFTEDMYSYARTNGASTGKWANAKTEDGSYWVWIPRFAYKVEYYRDKERLIRSSEPTEYEKISIIFLNGTSNDTYKEEETLEIKALPNGYMVLDAFSENETELEGIWVAKYEASTENLNTVLGGGNVLTTKAGNIDTLALVSKPNKTSWRGISYENAVLNSDHMYEEYESSLIENCEWEAIAILAQSDYGIGVNEISKNASYVTGNGGSSTGNITGVYDLAGGTWEYAEADSVKTNVRIIEYLDEMLHSNPDFENIVERTIRGTVKMDGADITSLPVDGSADSRVGYRVVLHVK